MNRMKIGLLSICCLGGCFGCAEPVEPLTLHDSNNTPQTATLLSGFASTVKAQIDQPDDVDYYKFQTKNPNYVSVSLSMPDELNLDLALYDSLLHGIDSSSLGGHAAEHLVIQLPSPGRFLLKVKGLPGSYSTAGFYRLSVFLGDSSRIADGPHLQLGNPTRAAPITDSLANFLLIKDQYAMSYNSLLGEANWVAWQLNSSWQGETTRLNDFRSDTSLPLFWYRVSQNDILGTGYDRGHLCPSADRTTNSTDNSETFLMTNIVPQHPDNNQGPWSELENYCRELTLEGAELFVTAGGYGSNGNLAGGKIRIPANIWKIIVVTEPGTGLAGISLKTRVVAVDMPNAGGIRNSDWRSFRVSVDHLEEATGFDFLSNLDEALQSVLEAKVDGL